MKHKHTQYIKDRANLLESHLKEAGVMLPHTEALNLVAKMEGYRSFTAAHHGRQHTPQGALGKAMRKFRTMNQGHPRAMAVEDYLADGGQHCPECGSTRIDDDRESGADHRHWEILVGCQDCHAQWWAVYELESRDGFSLGTPRAARALQNEACPYCDPENSELEYGTFTAGARGYQSMQCTTCQSRWMDIYKLVDAAEPQ